MRHSYSRNFGPIFFKFLHPMFGIETHQYRSVSSGFIENRAGRTHAFLAEKNGRQTQIVRRMQVRFRF